MNYRTIKTSKSNLVKHHLCKNVIHDIVLSDLLNLSKHFAKECKSFINYLFTSTRYVYDETYDTCSPHHNNCHYRDITNLELKASQRTFL